MKKYTKDHEWIDLNGSIATVGISEHAAKELGDITFVELPEVDEEATAGDVLTVVESVKAASDVFSPVTGIVCEINTALEDNPQLINESAEDEGWICKISGVNAEEIEELMNEADYQDYVKNL